MQERRVRHVEGVLGCSVQRSLGGDRLPHVVVAGTTEHGEAVGLLGGIGVGLRPHPDEAVLFAGGEGRGAAGAGVGVGDAPGHAAARPVGAEAPAVVAALEGALHHASGGERHVAVRAAVEHRADAASLAAKERHGNVVNAHRQGLGAEVLGGRGDVPGVEHPRDGDVASGEVLEGHHRCAAQLRVVVVRVHGAAL